MFAVPAAAAAAAAAAALLKFSASMQLYDSLAELLPSQEHCICHQAADLYVGQQLVTAVHTLFLLRAGTIQA